MSSVGNGKGGGPGIPLSGGGGGVQNDEALDKIVASGTFCELL